MNPPISYLNLAATAKSLAILDSYTSQAQNAAPMEFYAGDVTPRGFAFLLPSYDAASPYPFFFQDPAGFASFEIKVGALDQEPDGGTYTVTGTMGGTTTLIDFDEDPPDVVSAIASAVTGMTNAVLVSGTAGGPYVIDSGDTANPGLDLSSDSAGLTPVGSEAVIVKIQTADGVVHNRWSITLVKAFLVYNDSWSPLDPVSPNVTTQQVGGVGQSLVKVLTWNADAYGGTVSFTITKPDASTFTVSLPYNVDGPTVDQTILTAASVTELVTSTQKGDSGNYTVTFTGAWANDAVVNLTYESNTLLVPTGYQAPLTVSLAAAASLLGAETTADLLVVMRLTKVIGQPATVVQTAGTLIKTFPEGGNAGTGAPSNLNVHTGINWVKGLVDYTGGGATKLDGIATSVFNSLDAVEFLHPTDGLRGFQFVNPSAVLADGVVVVEPLDNASARWISFV